MSPALIGENSLAYQGPVIFLPDNDVVLLIDWDESNLPIFKGVIKSVMRELNASEARRHRISSVTVGCLLPLRKCLNEEMMNVLPSLDERNIGDQSELKRQFFNMRQNHHEPWIIHQKYTFKEQISAITSMYM